MDGSTLKDEDKCCNQEPDYTSKRCHLYNPLVVRSTAACCEQLPVEPQNAELDGADRDSIENLQGVVKL